MKKIFVLVLLLLFKSVYSQNESETGPSDEELEMIAKDIEKRDSIERKNASFMYVEFFDSVYPYRVDDKNYKVSIKLSGVDNYGQKIWLKYEYYDIIGKEEIMYLEDNIKRVYKSTNLGLFSVNCEENTYRVYEEKKYNKDGNLIESKSFDRTIENEIIPDTIIEFSKRFYCIKN